MSTKFWVLPPTRCAISVFQLAKKVPVGIAGRFFPNAQPLAPKFP
ncbi:MAG: hypothetical protein U0263_14665 [Polyangiaceae bacterium]